MDGILSLHEVMHHAHVKKQTGVILKLDFEKACDKVNWDFLLCCQKVRGFNYVWCSQIHQILHNETISVKINNQNCSYFQSLKGVRQGAPISLVIQYSGIISKMVFQAQRNGLFCGVVPDLVENRVATIQYAGDIVLFLMHDADKAIKLKLLLYMFELMSGMKTSIS